MWFRRKSDIDVRDLPQRLRETVSWCEYLLSNGPGLRAVDLLPPRSAAEAAEQKARGRELPDWIPTSMDARLGTAPYATAAAVVTTRSAKMRELGLVAPADGSRIGDAGRILCCINAALDDRVCSQVSKGFLDADDLPPCDTWIGVAGTTNPTLLAWVPARHVADVDEAIPCCPTEAYLWLSSANARLERALLRGN